MAAHMQIRRKTEHLADASRYGLLDPYTIFSMLDLAVIGAGPAGLSAAAALLHCRPKPRIKVSHDPAELEQHEQVKALS